MTNKYLIIIIVLLISLVGTASRLVFVQGKLYEAEMAWVEVERLRNDEAQKRHEKFFAPISLDEKVDTSEAVNSLLSD